MNKQTNFEKLIQNDVQTIKCPYCSASYNIHEGKCPYCDAANEYGQEEAYIDKLNAIKDKLDDMNDYAKESITSEAKSTIKKLCIPFIIAIVIAIIAGITTYYFVRIKPEKTAKAVMEWQKENFPKLDKMYEEGDYDGLLDFQDQIYLNNQEEVAKIFHWEHYQFLYLYGTYKELLDYPEYIGADDESGQYAREWVLYSALKILYTTPWEVSYKNRDLSDEEYDKLIEYQESAKLLLKEHFGIEDVESVLDSCMMDPPGVGVDFEKVKNKVKEYDWIE